MVPRPSPACAAAGSRSNRKSESRIGERMARQLAGRSLPGACRSLAVRSSVRAVQHEHTEHIAASADAVYAAIADVANLPKFVPQLTGARPVDGDHVEVDARYHGRDQHGQATFSSDAE